MKRILFTSAVIVSVLVFSSCKKTTTCTFTDSETGEVTVTEVETSRSLHEEAVHQHEKNGWVCGE